MSDEDEGEVGTLLYRQVWPWTLAPIQATPITAASRVLASAAVVYLRLASTARWVIAATTTPTTGVQRLVVGRVLRIVNHG